MKNWGKLVGGGGGVSALLGFRTLHLGIEFENNCGVVRMILTVWKSKTNVNNIILEISTRTHLEVVKKKWEHSEPFRL